MGGLGARSGGGGIVVGGEEGGAGVAVGRVESGGCERRVGGGGEGRVALRTWLGEERRNVVLLVERTGVRCWEDGMMDEDLMAFIVGSY